MPWLISSGLVGWSRITIRTVRACGKPARAPLDSLSAARRSLGDHVIYDACVTTLLPEAGITEACRAVVLAGSPERHKRDTTVLCVWKAAGHSLSSPSPFFLPKLKVGHFSPVSRLLCPGSALFSCPLVAWCCCVTPRPHVNKHFVVRGDQCSKSSC